MVAMFDPCMILQPPSLQAHGRSNTQQPHTLNYMAPDLCQQDPLLTGKEGLLKAAECWEGTSSLPPVPSTLTLCHGSAAGLGLEMLTPLLL